MHKTIQVNTALLDLALLSMLKYRRELKNCQTMEAQYGIFDKLHLSPNHMCYSYNGLVLVDY